MKRSTMAVTVAWLFSGCSMSLGVKGLSTGGAHQQAGESKGRRGSQNRFTLMSSKEIAKLGVEALLGQLYEVESVDVNMNRSPQRVAKGKWPFATREEYWTFNSKLYEIFKSHNPKPSEYLSGSMRLPYCLERGRQLGKSEAEAKDACDHKTLRSLSNYEPSDVLVNGDQAASALYLEMLLEEVGDPSYSKATREQFIATLGHERSWFDFYIPGDPNSLQSLHILPKPMGEWSHGIVKYGMTYADKHGLSAKLKASLKTALSTAPKYKCMWYPLIVEKPYLGGGRYGEPRVSELGPRPDVAGSGGDIPCSEVKKKRTDKAMMQVVGKDSANPKDLLAVETREKFRWEIRRSYGRPVSMFRIIYKYFKVPQ